jgi:hypothetical protein
MKAQTIFLTLFFWTSLVCAQVGVNTTSPKASLDIKATNSGSPSPVDGVLIPRIDNFTTMEPGPDQDGMLVFLTGNGTPTKGFYYWDVLTSTWIPLNKTRHYIGELYGGGIVYYVDADGQHGLIASLDDLGGGPVAWGLNGVDVNNCESYIDGAANTASLVAAGVQNGEAAGLCNGYTAGGFSDWYLPSLIELRKMAPALLTINSILQNDNNPQTNPVEVGGISSTDGFYWSSTEANSSFAKIHVFTQFVSNSQQKWQADSRVRAVRKF